jgi:hypothetical protein
MGNAGAKMKEGFNVLGKKIGEGYNTVKSFGKKTWDKVKSVPVLGQIANVVEKYTPIGLAATSAIRTADALAGGTSKLLQGDVKGAIGSATSYGRDLLNQKSPLLELAKGVPVLGKVASGVETAVNNVPIYAGMSMNTMRNIGNAGLNAVDAFKEGNVKEGFRNIAKGGAGYLGSRSGGLGMAGKLADKLL